MSPIALILDSVLAILLMIAVIIGMRLDRKLKVLRENHEAFAKSVMELNGAVARAQAGLGEFREGVVEAHGVLDGQISEARLLIKLLDERVKQAKAAAEAVLTAQPPPVAAPQPIAPQASARPVETRAPEPRTGRPGPLAELILERLPSLAPEFGAPAARPAAPAASPRSRARVDDDLFELPLTHRAPGGRP